MTLTLDTLDDRREIWHLLHRLPPGPRVQFLARRCQLAARPGLNAPVPQGYTPMLAAASRCDRADERLTTSVYADLLGLCANWNADLAGIALDLEARVKRASRSPA